MPKFADKQRISADGSPYTAWQKRTRIFCLLTIVWAGIELAAGAGIISLRQLLPFDISWLTGQLAVGPNTLVGGLFSLAAGLLGIRSAYDPHKSALFFWLVIATTVLVVWDFASAWSMGLVSPSALTSLLCMLFLAACAWNIRGQTGYFDKHPVPEQGE